MNCFDAFDAVNRPASSSLVSSTGVGAPWSLLADRLRAMPMLVCALSHEACLESVVTIAHAAADSVS